MEELLHPPDEPFEHLPEARQALLDRFKHYAVWHPRLVQVQTHVLDTIGEPADVVYVVVCGPSGVGKSKLAEVLARRLNTPKSASNGHFPFTFLLFKKSSWLRECSLFTARQRATRERRQVQTVPGQAHAIRARAVATSEQRDEGKR